MSMMSLTWSFSPAEVHEANQRTRSFMEPPLMEHSSFHTILQDEDTILAYDVSERFYLRLQVKRDVVEQTVEWQMEGWEAPEITAKDKGLVSLAAMTSLSIAFDKDRGEPDWTVWFGAPDYRMEAFYDDWNLFGGRAVLYEAMFRSKAVRNGDLTLDWGKGFSQ